MFIAIAPQEFALTFTNNSHPLPFENIYEKLHPIFTLSRGALSASATTSLNLGGNIRVNSGWSNNLPSVTNEGKVEVDGVISGSDVFGYGAGAIVNHTAGNIVAQVVGTKRRGFNMNGGGTWVMPGGSIRVRYINATAPIQFWI